MNKENTKKLYDDFPKLYSGRYKPLQENLMSFGFACGDGWFNLIYDLSKKISQIVPDAIALQVKEKFGGLRFYVINCNDEGFDEIHKTENLSFTICKNCGKPGKRIRGNWIKTLCEKCKNDN